MDLNKQFFSNNNKRIISDIIFNVAKKQLGIELKLDFAKIMEQVMNSVYSKHQKPPGMPDTKHLKNLSTIVISECLKYIKTGLSSNTQIALSDNSNNMSSMSSTSSMSSSAPYNQAFGNNIIPASQPFPFQQQMGAESPGNQLMDPRMMQQQQMRQQQMDPRMMQGRQMQNMGMQSMQGMQGMGMQGMGDSGGPLPFQQIDPRSENGVSDPEIMLAQKISDRNTLDRNHGMKNMNLPNFNNMHALSQEQQISKFLKKQNNVHPSIIQKFLNMTVLEQQRLAQAQPNMYHSILGTIQQMNSTSLTEKKQRKTGRKDKKLKKSRRKERKQKYDTNSDSETELDKDKNTNSSSDSEPQSEPEPESESDSDSTDNESGQEIANRLVNPYYNLSQEIPTAKFMGKAESESRLVHISLDFRKDLSDIDNNKYVLSLGDDFHNVQEIELESCMINQTYNLEGEPYIYCNIDEIGGDYNIARSKSHGQMNVFGKLFLDNSVNGFLTYRPENCRKRFKRPELINRITISFLNYNYDRIPLNKIAVKKLSKGSNQIKLTTKSTHNLTVEDRINLYKTDKDEVLVANLKVMEIPDSSVFITEAPTFSIEKQHQLSFEKLDVKCTLTFKLHQRVSND